MTEFQKRLHELMQAATSERDEFEGKWRQARRIIASTLKTAEMILLGVSFRDANGEGIYLARQSDRLEFVLNRDTWKVTRKSTRESEERIYDLEKITEDRIQSEVEEWVKIIYAH